ncbi:hypothetical protein [Symbioplanes lichenis]|uniref:hypothetical protein n=1 Tax=Symbioplanes lichenis TaxID=1629072 RepID=UPI003F694BD1
MLQAMHSVVDWLGFAVWGTGAGPLAEPVAGQWRPGEHRRACRRHRRALGRTPDGVVRLPPRPNG